MVKRPRPCPCCGEYGIDSPCSTVSRSHYISPQERKERRERRKREKYKLGNLLESTVVYTAGTIGGAIFGSIILGGLTEKAIPTLVGAGLGGAFGSFLTYVYRHQEDY